MAGQQRTVPVDRAGSEHLDLLEDFRGAAENSWEVHHFGKSQGFRVRGERMQHGRGDCPGAVRFQMGSRDAGTEHHAQVELQRDGRGEKVADGFDAHHVCQLMWVADRGGRSAREDGLLKRGRCQERTLDMHVRIDEAGDDTAASAVDDPLRFQSWLHADEDSVEDRKFSGQPSARKYVQVPDVLDCQVTFTFSLGGFNPANESRFDHSNPSFTLPVRFSKRES